MKDVLSVGTDGFRNRYTCGAYVGMCKVDFLVNLSGTADFIRLNRSIGYDWDFFIPALFNSTPSESPLSNDIFYHPNIV